MIRRGRRLVPGDTVGIIAPAGPAPAEVLDAFAAALAGVGFRVAVDPGCRAATGYLAGDDALRLAGLHRMFADPAIAGVFCLRGGYGASRLLDRIDYGLVAANPKVFVGYSDITALHMAFQRRCGLVTFHGPMGGAAGALAAGGDTASSLWSMLTMAEPRLANPAGQPLATLSPGAASGRLVGGNLCLVAASLGTPYEIDTADAILFLEDIGERPYRIDRLLTQLRLAGKLDQARGFLIGDFKDCDPAETRHDGRLAEVLAGFFADGGKPCLANLRAGHCEPMLTLPLGARIGLDADQALIEIQEPVTA